MEQIHSGVSLSLAIVDFRLSNCGHISQKKKKSALEYWRNSCLND